MGRTANPSPGESRREQAGCQRGPASLLRGVFFNHPLCFVKGPGTQRRLPPPASPDSSRRGRVRLTSGRESEPLAQTYRHQSMLPLLIGWVLTFLTAPPATDGLIVWSDVGRLGRPPFVTLSSSNGACPAVAGWCPVTVCLAQSKSGCLPFSAALGSGRLLSITETFIASAFPERWPAPHCSPAGPLASTFGEGGGRLSP